ncbi:MAG: hypothetical protein HY665_04090 [Chloroflexi bacterium]|nr:hypothetical protein [Chloroflexota bacterium]
MSQKRQKDTRTLVKEIFQAHPDWNARQVYDRYLLVIGDPKKAVTLNAVQKHVEVIRAIIQDESFQKLDRLWHSGLMDEHHEVIPQAIPYILGVQRHVGKRITVRQAIWIARLCFVKGLETPAMLWKVVRDYALYEIDWALSGGQGACDMSDLDARLQIGSTDVLIGYVLQVREDDIDEGALRRIRIEKHGDEPATKEYLGSDHGKESDQ